MQLYTRLTWDDFAAIVRSIPDCKIEGQTVSRKQAMVAVDWEPTRSPNWPYRWGNPILLDDNDARLYDDIVATLRARPDVSFDWLAVEIESQQWRVRQRDYADLFRDVWDEMNAFKNEGMSLHSPTGSRVDSAKQWIESGAPVTLWNSGTSVDVGLRARLLLPHKDISQAELAVVETIAYSPYPPDIERMRAIYGKLCEALNRRWGQVQTSPGATPQPLSKQAHMLRVWQWINTSGHRPADVKRALETVGLSGHTVDSWRGQVGGANVIGFRDAPPADFDLYASLVALKAIAPGVTQADFNNAMRGLV